MTATTPNPEPTPEEIERGLAELEAYLGRRAPEVEAPAAPQVDDEPAAPAAEDEPAPADEDDADEDDGQALLVDESEGETSRVRKLRAEVAEARLLGQLQDDPAPLLIDTPKVRRRRKKAGEAARLHQLAQDPTMRAWQAARMRRLLVTGGLVSLTLALAWSTAGVHGFAADGAPAWSPAWVFAWLVEPFMSLALIVVVGAKAFMGSRGQPIESRKLTRIEYLFLLLTLGMNAWPYLPGVAEVFSFSRLVLHILGPVVAVAIVTALPIVLAAFADLDHGTGSGPTGSPLLARSTAQTSGRQKPDIAALTARVRRLIASGDLKADASATAIRKALGCGTDTARAVRDALTTRT